MKKTNNEQQMMRAFAELIEVDPVAPEKQMDEAILSMMEKIFVRYFEKFITNSLWSKL